MSEQHYESTFVHFLRAGFLWATLITIPGIAVCWNLVPEHVFFEAHEEKNGEKKEAPSDPIPEDATTSNSFFNDGSKSKKPEKEFSSFAPETSIPQASAEELFTSPERKSLKQSFSSPTSSDVKPMEYSDSTDLTSEKVIPSSTSPENVVWAFDREEPLPKRLESTHSTTPTLSLTQKNFPLLEDQLKQLGAKYYRLEKWGSRGELYRFSCYVSASESYHYQKYFQAIDFDEIRVMEQVIDSIKKWKNR